MRAWGDTRCVFHEEPLTDEQQFAFARRFDELERYETPDHIRRRDEERLGAGVANFSNLRATARR